MHDALRRMVTRRSPRTSSDRAQRAERRACRSTGRGRASRSRRFRASAGRRETSVSSASTCAIGGQRELRASTSSRSRSPVACSDAGDRALPVDATRPCMPSSASGSRANSVPLAPATAQPGARACTPSNSMRVCETVAEPRMSWNRSSAPRGEMIERRATVASSSTKREPAGHERRRPAPGPPRGRSETGFRDADALGGDPAREDLERLVVRLEAADAYRGARVLDARWRRRVAGRSAVRVAPSTRIVTVPSDSSERDRAPQPRFGRHEPGEPRAAQRAARAANHCEQPANPFACRPSASQNSGVKLMCTRGLRPDSEIDCATSSPMLRNGSR